MILNFSFFLFSAKILTFFFFILFLIVEITITEMYTNLFMVVKYSLWSSFTTTMDNIGDHDDFIL